MGAEVKGRVMLDGFEVKGGQGTQLVRADLVLLLHYEGDIS